MSVVSPQRGNSRGVGMIIQGWFAVLLGGWGMFGIISVLGAEKSPAPLRQRPAAVQGSTEKTDTTGTSSTVVVLQQRLWRTVWEPKAATCLVKEPRLRGERCVWLWGKIQRDIRRQHALLRDMALLLCDRKEWQRCRRQKRRNKGCYRTTNRKRWSACFRVERRLDVITERLRERKKQGLQGKCGWILTIPARFQRIYFGPYPKLSDVRVR